MPFEFYRHECKPPSTEPDGRSVPSGYASELWRPSSAGRVPAGLPWFPYRVWAAFHSLGVFETKDYCILLIRDGAGRLVHRSHVFPRWFRHPFMGRTDLQVGDTFTEPEHRGKGLAEAALDAIVDLFAGEGRAIWYVVRDDNAASIRVAQKAGFKLVGRGERVKRFGSRMLGSFRIVEKTN